jgi:DNA-binding response OmpR family regulator
MIAYHNTPIYLAIFGTSSRSQLENFLVLEGCNISAYARAHELWQHFQIRPARMVITDRRFGGEFSGLDLARNLRSHLAVPYVYTIMLSTLSGSREIQEGIEAGADDYLLKPHSLFQIRARILVGLKWLADLDGANLPRPSDFGDAEKVTSFRQLAR